MQQHVSTPDGGLSSSREIPWAGVSHLMVVYLVWGTTFFAIRLAVGGEHAFPPFFLAAVRAGGAGLLLLAWAAWRRTRMWTSPGHLASIVLAGICIWAGGNGLVTFAERSADSHYAALVFGTVPIWTALFAALIQRQRISKAVVVSCTAGLCGLAILVAPGLLEGRHANPASVLALVAAAAFWALGAVVNVKASSGQASLTPIATAGIQQVSAALVLGLVAASQREVVSTPSVEAVSELVYLVLVGSVLAFTSFQIAQRMLPNSVVMTHAFVNPIVATILGAVFLNEAITVWTLLAALFVFFGVAGVFPQMARKFKA